MITLRYKSAGPTKALIPAMRSGELWAGCLERGRDIRIYLRTAEGLIDVETGMFYSGWVHKELHNARKLNGVLTVEDAS